MHSTVPETLPDTPFYTAVIADQGWSPDDLRVPLDLDAMIAASYGAGTPSALELWRPAEPREGQPLSLSDAGQSL